jgi:hypothetical protein
MFFYLFQPSKLLDGKTAEAKGIVSTAFGDIIVDWKVNERVNCINSKKNLATKPLYALG